MKKKVNTLVFFALLILMVKSGYSLSSSIDFSKYKFNSASSDLDYTVPNEDEVIAYTIAPVSFSIYLEKGFIGFKEALGFKESQGRYGVVNQFGYMGKYQFGKGTLAMIGINNSKNFLKDSELQEAAFKANTSRNKWILRKDIKRSTGLYINGIRVTESGILAAAHLAGAGNVKKYLRSGGSTQFADGNGVTICYYLKKFSGYDTSFIQPDRKATVNIL
ncbi:MAG: hypothetical protein ACI825_000864 [Planctomycetota bacterium]|jgi:hypothetical protein|uniref:peptidoglycan-binding protein LysM n=1 Tax=Patiriisocius sp. Uisw_047 TaxID=3230969 RepID=UPI0039EAA784